MLAQEVADHHARHADPDRAAASEQRADVQSETGEGRLFAACSATVVAAETCDRAAAAAETHQRETSRSERGHLLVAHGSKDSPGCYAWSIVHPFAKAALGAVAAAYANETLVKPTRIAKLARAFANQRGKPMLTFVPPPGQTLKSFVVPSLAIGDVNLHPSARGQANGLGQIGRGNAHRLPVADRTFACVFSYDVLEHLDRPDLALLEWHRIADRVFVVVPPWWSPDAWLNRWQIDPELRRALPVWVAQNRTIILPTSRGREYAARTCPTPQQRSTNPATRAPMDQARQSTEPVVRAAPGPVSNESAPGPSLPIVNLLSSTASQPWETPQSEGNLIEEPESFSANQNEPPYIPPDVGTSPSSASVSSMMIISGADFESD